MNAGTNLCASCGEANRDRARFCDGCGAALGVDSYGVEGTLPRACADGRYVPQELLGEGARKRVYLSTDERLGRDVALSIVKTEGLDRAGRARLAREARAMAHLGDHPRVVTVFDVGEEPDGTPYIVSQYMPGGSLTDCLAVAEAGRLPLDDALDMAEQVAQALAHAHAHGIVHRDIKPGNVWLASDGSACLGDFGLAAPTDASRMTSEGMLVGTVSYLAPEQALGRDPDPRADLYALGALLYEMLCGRPPFLGDDAVTVVSQHLHTAPVLPSWHRAEVPAELDDLVIALLAKDPQQRPANAFDVAARLAACRSAITTVTVQGPEASPVRADLRQADWGRFVGRAEELAQLRAVLDDALSGRTRLAMVVGEPGIGKTRLAEEIGAYASMRGAQVLWGHCYEGDLAAPYLPWVEALRAYVRGPAAAELGATSGGLAEVATILPELRELYPELAALPAIDDEAERLRLFEGVASFVRAAASAQPLVIVLDDLHWSDKPTLLLLQHVMRSVTGERVLIVGTYRDVELDRHHPLAEAMASLRRHRAYERVLVRGLPRDDVKALVEAIGGQTVQDEFANLLFRETEGNPFFVAEILRHLVETGVIRREGEGFVGAPELLTTALPEGVREVIGRRLDALSSECNEMLTTAAAMPAGFTIDVVGAVCGVSEDAMLDLLDEALAAQVVRERRDRDGSYEFAHALIRQTLYGELATPRRVRVHRRILEALEGLFANRLDAHLTELAYHSYQGAPGGDVVKAVDYATRAGDSAMTRAAYEEAARSYEMALQVLEHGADDELRPAELLLRLARARHRAGDGVGGKAACLEAAEAARSRGDARLLGQAAIEYHGTGAAATPGTGVDPAQVALYEATEAELRAAGDDPEVLALLARVLAYHMFATMLHDATRAHMLARDAVEFARRSGSPLARADAELASAFAGGHVDLTELRSLIDAVAVEEAQDRLLSALLSLLWFAGDRDEHDRVADRQAELAARTRSPGRIAAAVLHRAFRAALDGSFAEAEALFLSTLDTARKLGDPNLLSAVGLGRYPIYREQGRLAELERSTRRVASAPASIPGWKLAHGQILAEIGELDEARVIARNVANLLQDGVPFDYTVVAYMLAALAEVAWRTGEPDLAATALDWGNQPGLPRVCSVGSVGFHGAADRARGLCLEVLGRWDDAVPYHEAAVALHERLRAPVWVARSRFDLARALIARDADGDAARAVALVNQAIEAATQFEATRLLDEALSLKLSMQGIVSGASTALSIDAVSASITVDRPDLRKYAAADGHITFCFSDVVGYTTITERLGDTRTHALLGAHNTLLRDALDAHRGTEVKSQGDGFMLVFADADDALRFAIAFQRAITAHDWPADVAGLQVRIGVHRGEAIRDHDDFYGRTVILGARIATEAGGGEILVSDELRRAATNFEFDAARDVTLKGLSGTYAVHPLRW